MGQPAAATGSIPVAGRRQELRSKGEAQRTPRTWEFSRIFRGLGRPIGEFYTTVHRAILKENPGTQSAPRFGGSRRRENGLAMTSPTSNLIRIPKTIWVPSS